MFGRIIAVLIAAAVLVPAMLGYVSKSRQVANNYSSYYDIDD